MTRIAPEQSLLFMWALAAGLGLWMPAWGIFIRNIPLQPMDLIVLAGLPILLGFIRQISAIALRVLLPCIASLGLAWATMGGEILILVWTFAFALPFITLMTLTLQSPPARRVFLRSFLIGAALSIALFMAQIAFGAQALDWRTNIAFRLPPHYGRGFALFPEVSTFASHAGITCGMGVALVMHTLTPPRLRRYALILLLCAAMALLFSRSTSVLVLLPLLIITALAVTTRLTLNTLMLVLVLSAVLSLFLAMFLQVFYADRLETASAGRSAAMRLASVLGGLSPLWQGEIFGVGIGENDQVTRRAYDIGRDFGLQFGSLPNGVNSHIIGRIFEEGWPAVLQMLAGVLMLIRARRPARASPEQSALYVLAIGSFLSALLITGYRGIYTNWIWLAAAAAWAPPILARHRKAGAWAAI